jgi:hypothetical protein
LVRESLHEVHHENTVDRENRHGQVKALAARQPSHPLHSSRCTSPSSIAAGNVLGACPNYSLFSIFSSKRGKFFFYCSTLLI